MLMSIEQYIRMRKCDDGLNEFDLNKKIRNMGLCINYIVGYFGEYLDSAIVDCKEGVQNNEVAKLRKELYEYDSDVTEWIVTVYEEYGVRIDLPIWRFLAKNQLFLLSYKDEDFIKYALEFCLKNLYRYSFIINQTEMLVKLVKNLFCTKSMSVEGFKGFTHLSNEIQDWLKDTQNMYKVNLMQFAEKYIFDLCKKSPHQCMSIYKTEVDNGKNNIKVQDNPFRINELYHEIKDKPFIRGYKQKLEMLFVNVLFFNLYRLVGLGSYEAKSYWNTYINKCALEKVR